MKLPICYDLFAGLMGWGEAFSENGYKVIGFDIEDQFHNFGREKPPNCELVVRDVRSISGAELIKTYGVPAIIVASPPCQNYSYFAMPWKRGKQIAAAICGRGGFPESYKGPRTVADLNDLFYQCFRIQREVSAAAGHYVPLIIENVRGAQRWVGKARWNFGSFYLFGDVPALMPIPGKAIGAEVKAGDRNKGGSRDNHKWTVDWEEGRKLHGNNAPLRWDEREVQRLGDAGNGSTLTRESKGILLHAKSTEIRQLADAYDDPVMKNRILARLAGSKSSTRKRASAEIAKIPRPLALWIAKCFKPAP